jgi:hypothetical protein
VRLLKRLAWSILVLIPFGVPATEVYRSVDEQGRVTFSDRPGEPTDERVVVRPTVSTFGVSGRPRGEDGDRGSTESGSQGPAQGDSEESAAVRERNCQVARERAETYNMSRRLFRTLPDGEREYLSDAEIQDARAKAQADVANWCD